MHSLDLSVVVQRIRAELTADTGLLVATEGSLPRDEVIVVDPDGSVRPILAFCTAGESRLTYPARKELDTRMAVLTFFV